MEKRFIFSVFRAMEGWTYRFMVMDTLACPRISLRLFMSNPSSMHLVAKVCLVAWKLASWMLQAERIFLNRFCMVLGSRYRLASPVRRKVPEVWKSSRKLMMGSGRGMVRTEQALLGFHFGAPAF